MCCAKPLYTNDLERDIEREIQLLAESGHRPGAETKLSSDFQEIIAYFDELEYGLDVVCMEAQEVKAALSAMRNKTDKHDARGIAQLLRSGCSPGDRLMTLLTRAGV